MTDTGKIRQQTDRENEIVADILREFSQLQTTKSGVCTQCEEIAELIMPPARNTFFFGSETTVGEKKTDKQVDASGMMALSRFGAILDSLLTPRNMTWHGLRADNDYVMKDRGTKLWFEHATRTLFKYRYNPIANFSAQNQQIYQSLGAFGNSFMFVDEFDGPQKQRGLRYKAVPFGEIFWKENHQGLVCGFIRWFRMTAYQAVKMPGFKDRLPPAVMQALEKHSETRFNFLHRVEARSDYEPGRLDSKGKLFKSEYMIMEGKALLREGGYNTFPGAPTRYDQTPNEPYGRGPAGMVLPALKTLNAEKRVFLKQGHRAADPVLLTSDDGLVDGISFRPGSLNKGGWSSDGKPLVGTLPTGDIQITKEMMADEKSLINDAFLVTLFQILTETPTMTATEVIERTNEKGILLAPTVGRQQSEYLGPMIDRELDLLMFQGLLDPMPPRLQEAEGEYSVVYTSPLSRAMRAQEAAGFMRSVEGVKELTKITGDPSLLDPFNFDVSTPETAEINGVPPSWMCDEEQIAAKRQNRAKAQQRQEQIQAMPAQAAMMKAQAVAAEKGGGQPAQAPE